MNSLCRLFDWSLRRCAASPTPNEINWNPNQNNAQRLKGFVLVLSQIINECISNKYCRCDDEKEWRPRITRNAVGPVRLLHCSRTNKNGARGETLKDPPAKDYVGQQFIKVPGQRENCRPQRASDDRKCRCPKTRVNLCQFLEKHPVISHCIVNS